MKKTILVILILLVGSSIAFPKEEEVVTKSDPPKMREAYEYYVLGQKNPAFVLNNEANLLSIKGRYEEATEKYRQALAIAPNEPLILDNLAWTLIVEGRYPEALEYLKKSIALDPKNPSTNFYLGVAYYNLDDPKNAETYLRIAVTLDPGHPYSHYYLSKTFSKQGDLKKALIEAEAAALILDNAKIWNPDIALHLGDLYGRLEMFQKAILQYQKLVDERDYAFDANYGLGVAYGKFGDFDKAEKHLTMALKLDGNDPRVYYEMGKLYSGHDDKLKKALDYAEEALSYEPANGRFLYLVGWISYRMNDMENALAYMKKALAADPENATYRYQVKMLENEIAGKGGK
jgi:tetratricopeptide (TPR) repeat protein